MKKYDKVFIPLEPGTMCSDDNYRVFWEGFAGPSKDVPPVEVRPKSNVIVMTPEEAEKIWNAGWRAKALENNKNAKWIDFKSWIKSKGITL